MACCVPLMTVPSMTDIPALAFEEEVGEPPHAAREDALQDLLAGVLAADRAERAENGRAENLRLHRGPPVTVGEDSMSFYFKRSHDADHVGPRRPPA